MSHLLLDTHTLIWLADGNLPPSIENVIAQSPEPRYISVATIWEIAIKVGLGKLDLSVPISDLIGEPLLRRGIAYLPLTEEDLIAYSELPFPDPRHRDPFDRILIVQAKRRDLAIVSRDERFDAYQALRLWPS